MGETRAVQAENYPAIIGGASEWQQGL